MNLVLLSGGSGKRLWPLSNDVRSKQFLKLLTDENGQRQSMVQRVFSQIEEVCPDSNIVVATSESQADPLRNQLGQGVELVLEPERRDTFPAIALACAYLESKKQLSRDEVVVVMPVDPYTELGFFRTFADMEKAVQSDCAELVLMGIRPAFASPKYGYMTYECDGDSFLTPSVPRKVTGFVEKPEPERAEKLIEEGAVWNSGVFAFRLGYVLDLVRAELPFDNYDELRRNYGKLTRTSFDYKVVEHAKSIAAVFFDGKWKDLGTWTTISDEMAAPALGNVIMDGCSGSFAVNDLGIPMVIIGVDNIVAAASHDGILISSIAASPRVKDHANEIAARPMQEEKRWGEYSVVDTAEYSDGMRSITKHMVINKGQAISYQMHSKRDELWSVTDGEGLLCIDGAYRIMRRGDSVTIARGSRHAVRALTKLHLIEVQLGSDLDESDIERFDFEMPYSAEGLQCE
ncbi:MAG: cupin domain-containing protein [Ruminococcaceae bacterium]|nr:cupin domain-containing protein [Oscillospiraceae bacterium]